MIPNDESIITARTHGGVMADELIARFRFAFPRPWHVELPIASPGVHITTTAWTRRRALADAERFMAAWRAKQVTHG
jgi:hypothetical protein